MSAMYAIINTNGLYLMQIGFEHAFTANRELASKFISEDNAQLKIKKLPNYKGLTIIMIKNGI